MLPDLKQPSLFLVKLDLRPPILQVLLSPLVSGEDRKLMKRQFSGQKVLPTTESREMPKIIKILLQ